MSDSEVHDANGVLESRAQNQMNKQNTIALVKRDQSVHVSGDLQGVKIRGIKPFLIENFLSEDFEITRPIRQLGKVAYTIEFKKNGKKWRICKRQYEFRQLYENLVVEFEESHESGEKMPKLPKVEIDNTEESVMKRSMETHIEFLRDLAQDELFSCSEAMMEF